MTYYVFSGTLNPTHFTSLRLEVLAVDFLWCILSGINIVDEFCLDSYVSNGDNSDRDTRVQIGSGNETDMEKQD